MGANDLFKRIAIAYKLIRYGKGSCRLMTCGKCGCIWIRPVSEQPVAIAPFKFNEDDQVDLFWTEVDQCVNCGAVCQEFQAWNFDGDPDKLARALLKNNGEQK